MKLYKQQFTAAREDGHTADGMPGDCLRAAAATVLQEDPGTLRHYAMYASWWDAMRIDARSKFGLDWCYTTPELLHTWELHPSTLLIGSGPSPRGPFRHVVVIDLDLGLVHDPHPSGAGVQSIDGMFVLVGAPYDPAPTVHALTGGAVTFEPPKHPC